MKSPQDSEAHQLLEAFVASNRSERAFRALVENLSSLAYAGAQRRTRDPQLAEEITQNVFALLAQRAKSLRSHPSLLAWIHETTRLQCATALRAEREPSGDITGRRTQRDMSVELRNAKVIENWPKDGLRHTWISSLLALGVHRDWVADLAGNSPGIIRTNYKRPLPEKVAKRWFSVGLSGACSYSSK